MSKVYEALQKAHGERLRAVPRPELTQKSSAPPPQHSVLSETPSLQVEAEMLGLAHNISMLLPDDEKYVIQFIGSREGEGTSTVVREFANVLAGKGNKLVLLVETDLERLEQHRVFGLQPKLGWDQIIQQDRSLEEGLSQVGKSNLFLTTLWAQSVLKPTAGGKGQAGDLWSKARKQFDLILVESPGVGVNMEALAICAGVDGIILVVEAEKTRSHIVHHTRDRIFHAGGNLLGIVLNKRRLYIPRFIYKWL